MHENIPLNKKAKIRVSLFCAMILFLFARCDIFLDEHDHFDCVQSIIQKTDMDSLTHFVEELSGEIETNIHGTPYTIRSRNKYYEGNEKAALYIKQKFESYGLSTYEQVADDSCKNIVAVQKGTDYPDQEYILCAHYDSQPRAEVSPGADDNASGTAVVIEAARILSKYDTKYTLVYALWDEEEYGYAGSRYYARTAEQKSESIVGVIDLDMLGWDENDDGKFDIVTDATAESIELAQKVAEVNEEYRIGLIASIYNKEVHSDQLSFWEYGYNAILIIQNVSDDDVNEYYHSPEDRIEHFNSSYFESLSKLTIGTLAAFAIIEPPEIKFEHNNLIASCILSEVDKPRAF